MHKSEQFEHLIYNHFTSALLLPAVRNPTDLTVRFDRFKQPGERLIWLNRFNHPETDGRYNQILLDGRDEISAIWTFAKLFHPT